MSNFGKSEGSSTPGFGSTFGNSNTSGGGMFGSTKPFGSTASSGFGSGSTPNASIGGFGTGLNNASSNPGSGFGAAPVSNSGFGSSLSSTSGSSSTLFGGLKAPGSTSGPAFGSSVTTNSSTSSVFGAAPTLGAGFGTSSSTSSGGLFGTATSAPSTGLFGGAKAPGSTSGPAFGSSLSTSTTSNTGFFGAAGSGLGGSLTSSTPGTTTFGNNASAPQSTSSLFGAVASSAPLGFGTSNAGAQASNSLGFGTGLSKPAGGFGGFSLNTGTSTGINPVGSTSSFGSFGSSSLFGAKSTATSFGLTQGINNANPNAPVARLDPSTLDPWGSMKHFSSIPDSEVAKTNIKKRSIIQPELIDKPIESSKEPKLTEFSSLDSQRPTRKFSLLQSMAPTFQDCDEDLFNIDYHNLLIPGAYFSNEVEPIPVELLSDEESIDSFFSDEEGGEYFMTTPTAHQLSLMSPEQLKKVDDFTVMLPRVGRAKFLQPVDLSSLMPDFQANLEKCIGMRKGAFVLHQKALEMGLSCPIDVILYKLWLIDPETGARILDPQHPLYVSTLDLLKSTHNTTFISHDLSLGQWRFIYDLKD